MSAPKDNIQLTVRLPRPMVETLKASAAQHTRSVSQQIVHLLRTGGAA